MPSSDPSPIPADWLRVRLLPTELATHADLLVRLDAWRKRQQPRQEARGADGILEIHFDATTGRVSTSGPIEPSESIEQLFVDLDEFLRGGEASIPTSWQPGDELWRYSSGDASWEGLAGRAGFVWLRGGHTYRVFCTAMS
jgi:hypothetical protein